jgi:hypothetical protein
MRDAEFPFVVTEDEEIIARFKRLKDATKFASYHEWGDFHHNVAVSQMPTAFVCPRAREHKQLASLNIRGNTDGRRRSGKINSAANDGSGP